MIFWFDIYREMSRQQDPEYYDQVAAYKPEAGLEVPDEQDEALDLDRGQDLFEVRLPREIMSIIFSYLDPDSMKAVRLVSRLLW